MTRWCALDDEAGFDAVFTSGFGISASFLGQPDAELYTMTENLTVVRHVANACASPWLPTSIPAMATPSMSCARYVSSRMRRGRPGDRGPRDAEALPGHCRDGRDRAARQRRRQNQGGTDVRSNADLVIIARTDAKPRTRRSHVRRLRRRRRRHDLNRSTKPSPRKPTCVGSRPRCRYRDPSLIGHVGIRKAAGIRAFRGRKPRAYLTSPHPWSAQALRANLAALARAATVHKACRGRAWSSPNSNR